MMVRHEPHEAVEQVLPVMGARCRLGVELHGESRKVEGSQPLDDVVVEVDVGDLDASVAAVAVRRRTRPSDRGIDRETVVVRGDLDMPGGAVENGLVDAAVAVAELVRAVAQRPAEDLVAQADSEEGDAGIQDAAQQLDLAARGTGIPRSVGEEHAVRMEGEHLLERGRLRQDVNERSPLGQLPRAARLDPQVDGGDDGDRLYIVTDGKVKLSHSSDDGRENLIAVLGPGEIIGELTLFDPGPRSTTATAVSPASLLYLEHEDLMHVLDTNPTLAKHMLRALAQRLRRTNESLSDLVFSDVPGRVAKALLDLADRFGTATDKGVHVPHDLTQEELAQLVGASRETVNKSLADFVSRGWIRLEGRAVTLLDVDRLARRAR